MKKLKKMFIALLALNALVIPTSNAMSDHEADCSIWLCLPSGFPQGCGPALSKFKDRIKHFRSPLPNFGSCVAMPSNEIAIDFQSPTPPYKLVVTYATYINDGKGVKKTTSRFQNMRSCPSSGEIITQRNYTSGSRDIRETWLSAICTRVTEYGTTYNDYKYPYRTAGKPLEVTQGEFKPRLLRRSSSSNR